MKYKDYSVLSTKRSLLIDIEYRLLKGGLEVLEKNKIIDMVIQKKFKEVLQAKKEGRNYNFKQELKDELKLREEEIKEVSQNEWHKAKKILSEIENGATTFKTFEN